MANTIKIKRGLSSNIDNTTLAQGELAITTDTNELYVGVEGGKKKLGSDVVIIYDTDDESTVVKKLAEATDGPDLTGNPAKIKKECIYYEIGAPEWSRIYKLVYIASTVVDSPHTSVTFSGGYGELTMKIERGEKVNGEYQYTITKTTDSYEQTSNKIDEIGVKSYVSSSEYPSEKAVVDYVNKKIVQSDYNQNDSTASDYIKNRPCYEDEPTTMTLFSLSNPTLTTWQVLQSFESHSDQIDYMTNLFSLIPSLSLDGRKLDLNQTIPRTQLGELSELNFPSDLYNAILDYSIGYFYQDTLNNFFIGIVLVPSTDTNNDAKLMYYVFTSGTIPDNVTIKNLAFTFTEKNIKMMEDKYLYSIVDTSDDLNLYVYDYQKKFTKRNNISDLTTQPTVTPKPSIVATDTGELYLVSFDWDNYGEPI